MDFSLLNAFTFAEQCQGKPPLSTTTTKPCPYDDHLVPGARFLRPLALLQAVSCFGRGAGSEGRAQIVQSRLRPENQHREVSALQLSAAFWEKPLRGAGWSEAETRFSPGW